MDPLQRLRARMNEQLQHDKKERSGDAASPPVDDLQAAREASPGKTIYAISCAIQCPWAKCEAIYKVGLFVSKEAGQGFHIYCYRCREQIITLRDTLKIYGKNTYPIEEVRAAMKAQDGKYEAWCNELKAAYDVAKDIRDRVWDQAKTRESTLIEGEGGDRDVKIRMTAQTAEEAAEEMGVTANTASTRDSLDTMSREQLGEFFFDPAVEAKYKG